MKELRKFLDNERLVRYFVMAAIIIVLELIVFQLFYLYTKSYQLATILSFLFGVILNWAGGRKFVFGVSNHHPMREFILVMITSVIGLMIQLGVVYVCVSILFLYPLFGKFISLFFSFIWNYLFRSRVIYKHLK